MTEKFWKKDKDKNWIAEEEETPYPHLPNHDIRNLTKLSYINTPEILYHLQHHYQQQNIYTTAGKILLAVNPFMVTDLYNDETKAKFMNNKENLADTPHIYQTANEAILSEQKIQNFLISGESGSGKTETTKKILDYLALQYQDANNILPMILEFNTILEGFGNASTQRNHNSSRFGKFIQINIQNNLIYANIRTYLLEKVRLIGENLTNYHIFYSFGYEKNKKTFQRDDWNTDYLQKDNLQRIWEKYIQGYDWANIEKIITFCIELLENKTETVYGNIGKLLSEKTLKTGEESIRVPLDKNGSKNVRDTLVMVIYEKLFHKIIGLMNEKLGASRDHFKSFGILDIFGFEVFTENGFEQLCINYTNEALQSIFNRFVFEEEIKLFESEGILRSKITFDSNTQTERLEFFDKFFSLLDEKTIVGAKDSDLLLSLPNNKKVIHKKLESFIVYHYADNVEYKLGEFTEKNMEKVNYDIQQFMAQVMGEKQAQQQKKKGGTQTITSKFRDELGGLMRELGDSYLYFIRCIKPNEANLPNLWDNTKVEEQLNYCGITNALDLARQTYPVRIKKEEFMAKYGGYYAKISGIDVLEGKTMVFMVNEAYKKLKMVDSLGKIVKRNFLRREYSEKIAKIKRIQGACRVFIEGRHRKNRAAQIIIQASRFYLAKKELAELVRLAIEAKLAELARLAEEARLVELARIEELERLAEEARLAKEAKLLEEARIAEEVRLAEEARLVEERRLAEHAKTMEKAGLLKKCEELESEFKKLSYNYDKREMETNDIISHNKLYIQRLEEIIKKRNEEYKIISEKLAALDAEYSNQGEKLAALDAEYSNQGEKLAALDAEYSNQSENNNWISEKLESVELDYRNLTEMFQYLERQKSDSDDILSEKEEECANLTHKLEEKEEECSNQSEKLEEKEEECANQSKKMAALEEDNANQSKKMAALEDENANLCEKMAALEEENSNKNTRIIRLESNIDVLNIKIGIQKNMENEVLIKSSKIDNLQKELSMNNQKLQFYEMNEKHQFEKDSIIINLENKNKNKDLYIQDLEEENQNKEIEFQKFEEYKMLLGEKITTLLEESIVLKDENDRLKREIRNLQSKKWYENLLN